MKIAYLHQYFNTPEMSGGTRSYEFAKRMVKAGHEVHVVTTWREGTGDEKWFETSIDGINIHWLPIPYSNKLSFFRRILAFFKFAIYSIRYTLLLKPDLVFATSTPLTIAIPGVAVSKISSIPLVFEVRDLWPELPIAMDAIKNPVAIFFAKYLEKWAYKNSAAIVALSPGMKEGVVKSGTSDEKVVVIPNSCDFDLFDIDTDTIKAFKEKHKWINNRSLVVYCGTFGLVNGVSSIIEIAKELEKIDKDVCFLLVGDGIEFEKTQQLARENNLLDRSIFIWKQIPKSEVPVVMMSADLCMSLCIDKPEIRANSANKFFDSMACKKPILINYGGWQKDLLERNKSGLVIWQKDPRESAALISKYLADKDELKAAGVRAYSLGKKFFDREVLASNLLKVFELVQAGRKLEVANIEKGNYIERLGVNGEL